MKKEIGIIGLGKMGGNIVRKLIEKEWNVHGYDPVADTVALLEKEGMHGAASPAALCAALSSPRVVFIVVPAGKVVDDVLFGADGVVTALSKGDVVIDGGNSFFKDSIARGKKLAEKGIQFIDVGCSGGPHSILQGGACLMIGGDAAAFKTLEPLFKDLARPDGYKFFEGAGAGHFVKMVHNGIEYGMMQAIGEGFEMLKKAEFNLNLNDVADIYNHGSIIESRLTGWLKSGFDAYGEDLTEVSGSVGHTGEGEWTAKTAKEMGIPVKIIEESFKFRVESAEKPSYTGKVVSALRNQFGGHSIKK